MVPGAVPLPALVGRADPLSEEGSNDAEVGATGLRVPESVPLGIPVKTVDWLNEELSKGAEIVPI